MQFESKFNPSDKVYKVAQQREKVWSTCSFCGGSRIVTGVDNSILQCPECRGDGGRHLYKDLKWQVESGALTIGQIRIEFTPRSDKGLSEIFDNYKAQEENRIESYMCYETGIGSGSVYYAENLFSSIKEAQAECDKRNT